MIGEKLKKFKNLHRCWSCKKIIWCKPLKEETCEYCGNVNMYVPKNMRS